MPDWREVKMPFFPWGELRRLRALEVLLERPAWSEDDEWWARLTLARTAVGRSQLERLDRAHEALTQEER